MRKEEVVRGRREKHRETLGEPGALRAVGFDLNSGTGGREVRAIQGPEDRLVLDFLLRNSNFIW